MSASSGTSRSADTPDGGHPGVSHAVLLDTLWASMVSLYADLTTAAAAHGLTYSQAKALNVLRQGPAPMRSLADTLRCDASNITGIIDRLEARGLVHREASATDRRVKNVNLSEEGAAVVVRVRDGMHATHQALGALSEDERATLDSLLSRLFQTEADQS
ncbi:MarR family winged helix-turn-helix transcriptional regulator [Streptomyces sp. NPDC087843]|uniref:MarR family winged helix-turn-helix transcriptional regulator n=1 Tax=Streptomyces sp. NPDC087843 TaxID=3365804 RepID=UPI0037FB0B8D